MSVLGIFLNVLLFYIACYHSPSTMKSYAMFIMNFAITDFFACILDVFCEQRLTPGGWTLFYLSYGPCGYFGPRACFIAYSLMLHVYSYSLLCLLISFAYRLYILYRPAPSTKSVLSLILVFFIGTQDPTEEVEAELYKKFPEYKLDGATLSGTVDIRTFNVLFTVFYMTLPVTPVYICILIIRRKIVQKLIRASIHMHSRTKAMHDQLLTALTYQAAIPSFFWFAVLSYVIGQLGIYNHAALEYAGFTFVVLIPVMNPLATLIFIGPYRYQLKRFLGGKFSKIASVEKQLIIGTLDSRLLLSQGRRDDLDQRQFHEPKKNYPCIL
ncbi:unnamed protein product [Caenorhabditis auriculariae]|uniref:G protein-coupled receptor n=1 Tax=Caenorhabditis auriculariae TaxID=2777116 RepID=A0A8S1H5R7_9PELO|nr:unnamed protein product [Caenorhabditis auriculariae]